MEVEQGRIRESTAEKYLGEWFDMKGTNEIKIKKKEEKVGHMIQEVKRYGSWTKVGNMDLKVRLHLLEKNVMPSLTYNMENWTNITKRE